MDTPSDKSDKKPVSKTHGLTRQKIIEMALAQLRKKRAETDPKILDRIRDKIFSSPALMKKLGIEGEAVPQQKAPKVESVKAEPTTLVKPEAKISEDQKKLFAHVKQIVKAQEAEKAKVVRTQATQSEKVDKKKTLEMISKLMKIKPDLKN